MVNMVWNSTEIMYNQTNGSVEVSDDKNADIVELLPWSTSGIDGDWVGRIVTSFTMVLGTFGNVMTVTILRRLQTGWSSMNVYLTALAVSDSGMLYSGVLATWCRKVVRYDLYASNWVVCKLIVWTLNSTASLSAWLLVALTLQRALSVIWPHRVNLLCTRKMTGLVVGGITVIMFLLYSHILYGIDLVYIGNNTEPRCTFTTLSYQDFWGNIWVMLDMFLYSVLPSTFVVIGNCVLAWKLAASVREAKTKLASGDSGAMTTREKKASSVTKTVVVVSMTFILLTLPLMIYNTFFHLSASENPETREFHYFLYECFVIIAMTNFGINFYLYFLTGSRFRNEFKKLLCPYSQSNTNQSQATLTTTYTQDDGRSARSFTNRKAHKCEVTDDF